MKQFALFTGTFYYPNGGWDDLNSSFDTKEEAVQAGLASGYDWWHVVDINMGRVVDMECWHEGDEIK